nr:MAG: flagellar protein FlgN [Pseudomonadota bacterium]
MDRLEFVVDVETRALETHHDIDLEESNRRKSQILLELSRLMKVVDQEPLESQVIDRLSSVRQELARNQAVLELNLRAMNEVAEIVAASIRAEESDGTYQPSGHVRGPAR